MSLLRPDLPDLKRVDYVDMIQDPRHLFKGIRTEFKLFEVDRDKYFDRLITCSTIGSQEAQHCFVNRCKNRKNLGHISISLNRGEQDKHNSVELNSSR